MEDLLPFSLQVPGTRGPALRRLIPRRLNNLTIIFIANGLTLKTFRFYSMRDCIVNNALHSRIRGEMTQKLCCCTSIMLAHSGSGTSWIYITTLTRQVVLNSQQLKGSVPSPSEMAEIERLWPITWNWRIHQRPKTELLSYWALWMERVNVVT